MTVRDQSSAVACMAENWPIIAALLGGTSAMRKNASLLPKWPNEEQKSYEARLAVATLFPAFQRTIEVLTGKPFSKPLTIGEDVPTRIKGWTENIDLQGRNLHAFAASLCEEALSYGLSGILVDYPPTKDKDGKPLYTTQAAEASAGVRPYFVHIHPGQILGWRSTRVNGAEVLTQLRLLECVTEEDGDFGEKQIEQVRVLMPGNWQIWRKSNAPTSKEEWVLHDHGSTSLSVIPFVTVYGKRTGFMRAAPPLLEMAHMNVKHWQSQSDQDTILHVARVPILAVIGVDDDKWSLTVGASSAVKLPLNGDIKFVEHNGNSIEAGRKSLLDLEDQMRQAGAELLVIKPGNITESQTLADNEQGACALQRIVSDLEDGIDQALQFMAMWIGEAQGGHAEIYDDFGAATLAEASAELLLKMKQSGDLSRQTLQSELKRRGILSPEFDSQQEEDLIAGQPPMLGDA